MSAALQAEAHSSQGPMVSRALQLTPMQLSMALVLLHVFCTIGGADGGPVWARAYLYARSAYSSNNGTSSALSSAVACGLSRKYLLTNVSRDVQIPASAEGAAHESATQPHTQRRAMLIHCECSNPSERGIDADHAS